ncbi:sulfotransferase 6B1 [Cheilinus undulatus]|uniref:sulfotransferase 6B1 n=1 Tax=Cheilinus undulatus TaxID=241271 RepID=UPI001BD56140|nr:sulfotransferase 6B1 [Cheilinus undulatus]
MSSDDFTSSAQSKLQKAKDMKDEDKMYTYNGVKYPSLMCPEDHLKALVDMEARKDDLVLVAYPKCGFNWMVGVVRKIITEATGVKVETKMPPLIEFMGPQALKAVSEAPSPRFLGTHLHPDNIPASFHEKKTKMLVIFRNPKDTLVSFYHFCNKNPVLPNVEWDSFFCDFMCGNVGWGSYFDHALAWEEKMNDPNVLFVTFEELKEDLSKGIRQISTFFDLSLTESQVQQITEESTFKAMKQCSANAHIIGDIIFRKGEVGDWKNHFTPEQSRKMDEAFNEKLAGTRLGAKLNYQKYCQ